MADAENENPIEWQGLLKIVNNKPELAKELLTMFGAEIPILADAINTAYQKSDFVEMKNQVHKLHGSCAYTGAPHLKLLTQQLEILLRARNLTVIETVLNQLNTEIKRVLTAIKEQSYVNDRK